VEGGVAFAAIALHCRIRRDRIWRVTGKVRNAHLRVVDWFNPSIAHQHCCTSGPVYPGLSCSCAQYVPNCPWRSPTRWDRFNDCSRGPTRAGVCVLAVSALGAEGSHLKFLRELVGRVSDQIPLEAFPLRRSHSAARPGSWGNDGNQVACRSVLCT
jgi:hypothetical protein